MVSERIDLASDNSLVDQCKNILVAQVQCALDQLGENVQDAKIHGARKALKRARATLRLLRPAIGDEVYRRTNVSLRDIARPLSQARDAEVLGEALDRLVRRSGQLAQCLDLTKVERFLSRQRARAKESAHVREQFASLRNALSSIKSRVQHWKVDEDSSSTVFDAMRRSYSRVRKARRTALKHGSTDHLHEWRKQTKYLWHQIEVFEPLEPGKLGTYADSLHRLSEYLGEDHDLAVLRSTIFDSQSVLSNEASDTLKRLIDRRRVELQLKGFALAESLLYRGAKRWQRDVKDAWKEQSRRRRHALRVVSDEPEEDVGVEVLRAQRHKNSSTMLH